jgi:hypothetical protein
MQELPSRMNYIIVLLLDPELDLAVCEVKKLEEKTKTEGMIVVRSQGKLYETEHYAIG